MSNILSGSALLTAQTSQAQTPVSAKDVAKAQKAAQDFEGVFLSQMMGQMFSGVSTDGPFGGGQGEQMFRSLMLDEYGKQVAAQGGIGLASHVTAELLKHQEAAQGGQSVPAAADPAAANFPTIDPSVAGAAK